MVKYLGMGCGCAAVLHSLGPRHKSAKLEDHERYVVYVWRRAGEEWDPACLNTPPRRKCGIMIWKCISYSGVGTLAYVEKI